MKNPVFEATVVVVCSVVLALTVIVTWFLKCFWPELYNP